MGKKVRLTPTNIVPNCAFKSFELKVIPVRRGNQYTNPASKAKTAPILKT